MIINLFSSFDPSTSNYLRINWISSFIPILILPIIYWNFPSRIQYLINIIFKYINKEISNNISNSSQKIILIFSCLFWFIIINNLIGLYPYIFTSTSHLSLTLIITLPLWTILIIFGWFNKTSIIFSHLVPNGTPIILASFIVLIETTRNIIRPITLSVRLRANIIAGHLLLTLLRNISENIPLIYILTIPILIILLILEYAVAIIQRYVFITLLSLYLTEIN